MSGAIYWEIPEEILEFRVILPGPDTVSGELTGRTSGKSSEFPVEICWRIHARRSLGVISEGIPGNITVISVEIISKESLKELPRKSFK